MKKLFLLCVLVLTLPSLVLPGSHRLYAQDRYPPTEAQKKAIEQWASVIRRCQSTKVMFEVTDLLKEVTDKVRAHKDKAKNFLFVIALEEMHKGATLKAQAFKKRDGELMEQAERKIRCSVDFINGRVIY